MEWVSDSNLVLFHASTILLLALCAIETISLFFGFSFQGGVDDFLPDHSLDGVDGTGGILGWLYFGKIPFLILFILFLGVFSVIGYTLVMVVQSVTLITLPPTISGVIAFVLSIPFLRTVGSLYVKYMPGFETEAISEQSLVGQRGVVTVGTATKEKPAEVHITSLAGQDIYLMVKMQYEEESVPQGGEVILTQHIEENMYLGRPGLASI